VPVAVEGAAEHALACSQRDDGQEHSGQAKPDSAPQLPARERAAGGFEAGSARASAPHTSPNDLAAFRRTPREPRTKRWRPRSPPCWRGTHRWDTRRLSRASIGTCCQQERFLRPLPACSRGCTT
jgi:hypothetical protein